MVQDGRVSLQLVASRKEKDKKEKPFLIKCSSWMKQVQLMACNNGRFGATQMARMRVDVIAVHLHVSYSTVTVK